MLLVKRRILVLLTLIIVPYGTIFSQQAGISSGKLIRHELFISKMVANRNVDVWLPDGYS